MRYQVSPLGLTFKFAQTEEEFCLSVFIIPEIREADTEKKRKEKRWRDYYLLLNQ